MRLEIDNWLSLLWTVLGAFGGVAAITAAMVYFLADLFSKRTLQREAAALAAQTSYTAHELSLRKSSYEKHLELLLEY